MSAYLLDTPLVTAYLRGRPRTVALLAPWMAALRSLLRQFRVYELTYAVLERYADVRRAMRPPHGPGLIGDMDTLIAATALVHGLTVVALDGDYARVPGLSLLHLPRSAL